MVKEEATKILVILETAYPNYYKSLTQQERARIRNLWASQFAQVPTRLVVKAIENLVSTSKYPPAISEVWEVIRAFQKDAENLLAQHNDCLRALKGADNMLLEGIPEEVVEQIKEDIKSKLLSVEQIKELEQIATMETTRNNNTLTLLIKH